MYRFLKNAAVYVFWILFLFFLQIIVSYILPYPFDQIDPIFIFFLWKVVYRNSLQFLWLVVPIYFILNLFTSLSFGITGIAVFCSIILVRQIFLIWFSAYSWYNIFLLGLVGFILNSLFMIIFTVIIPLLTARRTSYELGEVYTILVEIFLNAAVFFLYYGIYNVVRPKKRYNYTF